MHAKILPRHFNFILSSPPVLKSRESLYFLEIFSNYKLSYVNYSVNANQPIKNHELCACKETSLYPILNRLLEKDLVSTSNVVTEKKKIRVYYHLSETGKEYYEDMKKNYAAYITTVNNFLNLKLEV